MEQSKIIDTLETYHIPLLTHTPCYSAATAASHRNRTSEPSYSSPCGLPLPRLPRHRVVPFLGLAVVHCPGALRAAWSTWSRNDFHRTWTVRGEADSWVHDRTCNAPRPTLQKTSSYSEFRRVICFICCIHPCIMCIASCHHAIMSLTFASQLNYQIA